MAGPSVVSTVAHTGSDSMSGGSMIVPAGPGSSVLARVGVAPWQPRPDDAYNFDSRTNFKEELPVWGFRPAVAPHRLSIIVFPPKLPGTRVPQSEDVLFNNNNVL